MSKTLKKVSPSAGRKSAISFNSKQVTKRLLGALSARAQDVLIKRYGLGDKVKRMTLEAIGELYGITRERVRQIENYALGSIRKSDAYTKDKNAFAELKEELMFFGGIASEEHFLAHLSADAGVRNHFHFILVVGEDFEKRKEDEHFEHRWHADTDLAEKVEEALKQLYASLSYEELVSESDVIATFLSHLKNVAEVYRTEEMTRRWLTMSKVVSSNPLGEWGHSASPNVTPKGVRDFAYLAIRNHGSPLHFSEVAKRINELFEKKAHVATTHNELIKDDRFVLVGRGLYALAEWGYMQGVVRDVITKILKEHGALTKDDVVAKVLKERYVKPNTILVNLQDSKYFSKNPDGTYVLA
ncbi:MAG: hypothetical protein NUW02_03350 [Candidatus Campbellbacteria bacterium]|nr:hypothetical protein [Candidatus Campbellbacteria bacterium]